MLASDDPADLTPEERFDEIAKILAHGLLRPKGRAGVGRSASLRDLRSGAAWSLHSQHA